MSEASKTMSAAQVAAAFDAAKKAMPDEMRKADLLAEVRKVHYDASIRKGFTPAQALTLCMNTNFS